MSHSDVKLECFESTPPPPPTHSAPSKRKLIKCFDCTPLFSLRNAYYGYFPFWRKRCNFRVSHPQRPFFLSFFYHDKGMNAKRFHASFSSFWETAISLENEKEQNNSKKKKKKKKKKNGETVGSGRQTFFFFSQKRLIIKKELQRPHSPSQPPSPPTRISFSAIFFKVCKERGKKEKRSNWFSLFPHRDFRNGWGEENSAKTP